MLRRVERFGGLLGSAAVDRRRRRQGCSMTIKIIVADDHHCLRAELREIVQGMPDVAVVAEAADGVEAVGLSQRHLPDLVIMDVAMPALNGIDATRAILKEQPSVLVLGLSMHGEGQYITRMLDAGACGYLLKDCAAEELPGAIRAVVGGARYLSPRLRHARPGGTTRSLTFVMGRCRQARQSRITLN